MYMYFGLIIMCIPSHALSFELVHNFKMIEKQSWGILVDLLTARYYCYDASGHFELLINDAHKQIVYIPSCLNVGVQDFLAPYFQHYYVFMYRTCTLTLSLLYVCVCMHVCVRACVHACVSVCVCVQLSHTSVCHRWRMLWMQPHSPRPLMRHQTLS